MKKVLIGCLGLIALLAIAVVVLIVALPSEFQVTRTRVVDATPQEAYAVAADLHDWPEWTFWSREGDPSATWDFAGEVGQPGHTMSWNGDTWGEGEIVFTECVPGEVLRYELTFVEAGEPMTTPGSIRFAPSGSGTEVTWDMSGELSGIGKLGGLFIDGIIGAMFEESLSGLDAQLAAGPAEGAADGADTSDGE